MSSVNEKMTAIADAIRNTGSLTGKMNLDEMAEGVYTVYDKGYTDGQASKPFEVHKIYVSETKTSGTHVFLEGNDFITKNYDKPGFGIQIFYLPSYTEGNGMAYAYTGNVPIHSISTGEETKNNFMLNVRDDGTFRIRVDTNTPYFDENGNLKMTTSATNGILKEGYYLIILSVVNIPEEVTQ